MILKSEHLTVSFGYSNLKSSAVLNKLHGRLVTFGERAEQTLSRRFTQLLNLAVWGQKTFEAVVTAGSLEYIKVMYTL